MGVGGSGCGGRSILKSFCYDLAIFVVCWIIFAVVGLPGENGAKEGRKFQHYLQ